MDSRLIRPVEARLGGAPVRIAASERRGSRVGGEPSFIVSIQARVRPVGDAPVPPTPLPAN